MHQTDYESLTVPELKELADKRGIELLSDARKAEIIAALEASDQLLKPEGKEGEGKNAYNYTMSSTVEEVPLDSEDFRKIKLLS